MTLPATMFKVFAPTLVCSRDEATGDLRIEGIASSTVRDHHGDAISQKALQKMADSALHMTIFMNHEYRVPQDVFGSVEKSRVIKTGEIDDKTKSEIWDLRFGIVVAKSNPEAVKTFELIEKDKVKLGLSIGAMLPDGGYTKDTTDGGRFLIDDIDIIETSMVAIPANPRSFVDYAFKALTGVFPESKNRVSKLAEFTQKYVAGIDLPEEETDDVAAVDAVLAGEDPDVAKKKDGNVVEGGVTIDGESISESDEAAAKETAEGNDVSRETNPDSDTGESDETTPEEVDKAHLAEGDEFEPIEVDVASGLQIVNGAPHPDKTAQKGGHIHPHAHGHSHEHEHGFEDNKTVHSHAHGHQHSHDHGADHEHDDTMNDYSHNHPHNGSYDSEHAHEDSSKGAKKSLEPDTSKAKVTVWENSDGSKVTEVNTGRQRANADESQSVQNSSEPETTGGLAGAEADTTAAVTNLDDAELLSALTEIVTKSGQNTGLLIQKLVGQNRSLKDRIASLEGEREAVLKAAKTAIDGAGEVIRQVGRLPRGRVTLDNHPQIEAGLDDVAHIYNADVRKLITKGR